MPRTEPFEAFSDRYDAWFDRHEEAYHAELAAIRQLLPGTAARGLEVGVGTGKFAVPLGVHLGIEPSERMAIKAEQQGITVLRGVAERLPFPAAGFDFVLMVTTICFVDDILQSFREAFRVLQPRGCLVLGFVDRDSQLGQTYLLQKQTNVFYRDATFYSAQEVQGFLLETGFGHLAFRQTLIPGETRGTVESGFGKGGFVVARGEKNG